jgi:hypothetical protein
MIQESKFRPSIASTATGLISALFLFSMPCPANAQPVASEEQKVAAAQKAAQQYSACKGIAPFYWEIGNGAKLLASGSTGDGSIRRDTNFPIASASKWVFGAYVIQRLKGQLDPRTEKSLKMMSGYTNLSATSCIFTPTVQACFDKGSNATYSPQNDNKFFYNGGHFQKWAVDHGLGPMKRDEVVAEYQKQLGTDFHFSFGAFQMAGGIKTSAENYAIFLRKILNGQLLMKNFLGANPTCTLPRQCSQAVRSPVHMAWHYSYAHWVEDDPAGDGSFSSPGAFGFYPWIDATKTYYGIISRLHRTDREGGEIAAGAASAQCGKLIRRAYFSGTASNE